MIRIKTTMSESIKWAKIAKTDDGVCIWGMKHSGMHFDVWIYDGEVVGHEHEGCFKFGKKVISTKFDPRQLVAEITNSTEFFSTYALYMDTLTYMVVYGAITAPL